MIINSQHAHETLHTTRQNQAIQLFSQSQVKSSTHRPRMPVLDTETRNFLSACSAGDLELAKSSLAGGADVNGRRGYLLMSQSGLHSAARWGDDRGELLDLLLAQPGLDVNIRDDHNWTPLMEACFGGSENSLMKLLQVDGIEINYQNFSGQTALHLAFENDNLGCIKILGEASGLNWNLKDQMEWTPLLTAAVLGRADSLEIILNVPQHQVDLTVIDNKGFNVAWCALFNAMDNKEDEEEEYRGDRKRCVELLTADPRVDWNFRDPEDGDTPLHFCLENGELERGEVELAKIIIKNPSVELNVQNNAGKFPETIAR